MNYYLVTWKDATSTFKEEFSEVVEADNPKTASDKIQPTRAGQEVTITDVKMIVNPMTSYTLLKNHLHNTLELKKEDIRGMVKEAVEDIVERRLDVFLNYEDSIKRVIDNAIRERAWHSMLMSNSKKLDEVLQDKIVREVTAKLVKEIGIDVKIKRKAPQSFGACACTTCSGYCACGVEGHHGK